MSLFQCDNAVVDVVADPTAIQTPLGIVRLKARLSGKALEDAAPTDTYRVSGSGRLMVWQRGDLDIELLICRPHVSPPLDLPVTETWGALWRVRAKSLTGPILFWAEWDEGYVWAEGGPNSGQYLYAKTWEDGRTDVTIGTQDDEMLARRSRNNDHLPPQWERYFTGQNDSRWIGHPIHNYYSLTGLPCPLLPLTAGQEIQIQFAVAWTHTYELSSTATSIAVEASPSQILAGGACS